MININADYRLNRQRIEEYCCIMTDGNDAKRKNATPEYAYSKQGLALSEISVLRE